jgi:uncharacterized membrane protein YhhN
MGRTKMGIPMTAPRRRWSFSLSTLFVVVTVIGIIVRFGGFIRTDSRYDGPILLVAFALSTLVALATTRDFRRRKKDKAEPSPATPADRP